MTIISKVWLALVRHKRKKLLKTHNEFIAHWKHKSLWNTTEPLNCEQFISPLCDWYYAHRGKTLELKHPKTFDEKIQWLKIYDSARTKGLYADKYQAKQLVVGEIGDTHIVPTLGVWDCFDCIDFESLPDRFVLKATHGSHWNYFVPDKHRLNTSLAKQKLTEWLSTNYAFSKGFELHYCFIKPRIIAEPFIGADPTSLLHYRFFCFNGVPHIVRLGRVYSYGKPFYYFMDMDSKQLPFAMRGGRMPAPPPSANMERMQQICVALAKDFYFVRIDFFETNGQFYFGELTFTPSSGIARWRREKYNLEYGSLLDIPCF